MNENLDKGIEEINEASFEDRLMLLDKLFEQSVGEAELGYFIQNEYMFRIAMKTLHRMATNGGKI